MNALQLEAIKVAIKQDATGYILTLRIHPDEIPEQLLRDFVGARYGVAMVRINDDETPVRKTVDEFVKKAGILCRSKNFQNFLKDESLSVVCTEEAAIETVHNVCGISSRSELSKNMQAREAFQNLLDKYEIWSETHDPF